MATRIERLPQECWRIGEIRRALAEAAADDFATAEEIAAVRRKYAARMIAPRAADSAATLLAIGDADGVSIG